MPFTSSYKHFKERYFKTFVELDGKPFFYDLERKTQISLPLDPVSNALPLLAKVFHESPEQRKFMNN